MAAFQHPAFLVNSVFSPNASAIKAPAAFDEFIPNLNQFYSYSGHSQKPLFHNQEGSFFDASVEQQSIDEPSSVTGKQSTKSLSLSMADNAESGEQVTQNWVPVGKKRKFKNGSSSNSANSEGAKKVKCKKQRAEKESKKEVNNDKKDQNKATEEPPKGYIHVRARRGQATDSHSLAERVRREKISKRMKMLQGLVPGCDKITGKALMLDEIINYVQSLQNQVEFLSMKLASLDPMVYNFGLMDLDPMVFGTEDAASLYWGVDEQQRQSTVNQFGFCGNNLCSFQ